MSKLIPIEDAAKILGLSVEKLNELRSENELFGYRDGSTWKFKMSELERVALDLGISISPLGSVNDAIEDALGDSSEDDSFKLDLGLEDSALDLFLDSASDELVTDDSSVDIFQATIGREVSGTASDILSNEAEEDDDGDMIDLAESGLLVKGSSKDLVLDGPEDDDELVLFDSSEDLNLDQVLAEADDDLTIEDSSDNLKLEASSEDLQLDDLGLVDGGELSLEGSSLELGSEPHTSGSPSSTGDDLFSEASSSDASSTGKLVAGSDADDLMLGGEDDLLDDELGLVDSALFENSAAGSDLEESEELILADDDSSPLLLKAGENDLLLDDDDLELDALGGDELDLSDDDIILVDDVADADSATLMQEDDFNLTPHEISGDDDDSSGSQVIALAASEIYADDSAATMLGGEEFDQHSFDGGEYDPTVGLVGAGVAGAAMAAGTGSPATEDASYSKWQIGGLALTAAALFLGCIVAYGTAQNLWMPDDEVVNSGIMKLFIDSLGMN